MLANILWYKCNYDNCRALHNGETKIHIFCIGDVYLVILAIMKHVRDTI